jgi:DUF4097 and DUF4098 domain-containing protein YvlB
MRTCIAIAALLSVFGATPSRAYAQRFPFERAFEGPAPSKIDVSTVRGQIEVIAGEDDRIVVGGAATVRIGWNVPANAVELARQVAANPPITRDGDTLRLRDPGDDAMRRAVTVSYQVRVPPDTQVQTSSTSGATTVRGVAASVDVRTQSGAIALSSLSGVVTASSGSGAIDADGIGALTVRTNSSAFTGRSLRSSLNARTESGAIDAALAGNGHVDVETGSSAIRLWGVRGGLTARTRSGGVTVQGAPGGEWIASTGSSSVNFDLEGGRGFTIDAFTGSGSVDLSGAPVQGTVSKREVRGSVEGGGAPVRINSRSGSIRVRVGGP